MGVVGQAIDDRDVRVFGDLLEDGLGERADDDRVEVAREDVRDVARRLPRAESDLGPGEVDGVSSELLDRKLERHPRPQGWLLEEQADAPGGEERLVGVPLAHVLEAVGEVEHREQLFAAPVRDPQEIPPLQALHRMDASAPSFLQATLVAAAWGSTSIRRPVAQGTASALLRFTPVFASAWDRCFLTVRVDGLRDVPTGSAHLASILRAP